MKCLVTTSGEGQITDFQRIPGRVAEGLVFLGRVGSSEADSMLHLVGVEDRDRGHRLQS